MNSVFRVFPVQEVNKESQEIMKRALEEVS
jgi:hypothetical protein